MVVNDYIEWIIELDRILVDCGIESSNYDEFHINEAISTTERIIEEHGAVSPLAITEQMIDEYTQYAIQENPSKKEYYETISYYVKRRLVSK